MAVGTIVGSTVGSTVGPAIDTAVGVAAGAADDISAATVGVGPAEGPQADTVTLTSNKMVRKNGFWFISSSFGKLAFRSSGAGAANADWQGRMANRPNKRYYTPAGPFVFPSPEQDAGR